MCLSRGRLAELMMTLVIVTAWPAASASQLDVTYLANAGFLLDDGEHKVLVDALFGDGLRGYPRVPEPTRSILEGARPPFDDVDLVLATHHHGVHFDPDAVTRFLIASPGTRFVSTPQAALRLEGVTQWSKISEQVLAILPDEGSVETVELRGLELQIMNLHHGRNRRPPVQNLGFLFDLGGQRILHVGDTEVERRDVETLNLPSFDVTLGLLPTWLLSYEIWADVVKHDIQPEHIIGMHMTTRDAPASFYGPGGSYAKRLQRIGQNFPHARVVTEPGVVLRFQ